MKQMDEHTNALSPVASDSLVSSMNSSVMLADMFVRKSYLEVLEAADILPLRPEFQAIAPGSNLRLMHMEGILYSKDDKLSQKIRTLFGAVESFGQSVMLLINGKKDRVDLYLGVCSDQPEEVSVCAKTLIHSLNGALPGCKCRAIRLSDTRQVLEDIFPQEEPIHIAAIPALPCNEDGDPYDSVEKLDVLIDGMRGKPFSMVLLGKAMAQHELLAQRQGLERLYTEISPMQRQDRTISESDSKTLGVNFSHSISNSLSYSLSTTHGTAVTRGSGTSTNTAPDNSSMTKWQSAMGLVGSAISIGSMAAFNVPVGQNPLQHLYFGSSVGGVLTNIAQLTGLMPKPNLTSTGTTEHTDQSENESTTDGKTETNGTSDTQGTSESDSHTTGQTLQMSVTNKAVADLLETIDRQIKQLDRILQEGAFEMAAYFVAGDSESAMAASNLYRSMTSAVRRPELRSPILHWEGKRNTGLLMDYLRRGMHPEFSFPGADGAPIVRAAQIVGLRDVPAYFSLPVRSVSGFAASTYAPFSRDIIVQNPHMFSGEETRKIRIGSIYHLGRTDSRSPVEFKVDDLTKHLFVAGASGVGKSNFCYLLLDRLAAHGINALVIEPAKGEYSRVLGGREGWRVFGVDAMSSPVLRINPFAFPDTMSPTQHIERLLDIFNAAWPMYSAMPAILKDALETIYLEKGFDLITGYRPEGAEFPCFRELLDALPRVINASAYSAEVKGNYTGALVTRVKSLTNGIYGAIFGKDEIGDAALFDGSVIVDISKIGSEETKSLIMGVMVMRLMEYRISQGSMNAPLTHVTVLEEAHHLLRGGSTGSAEGANMRAASVEMIANAIAEMRTYGEGFIIADQSPAVMDPSAIRNTQTKVFFMQQEGEDRRIAANSLSLTQDQQQELARLTTGVAAVYQTGWSDAVQCKVDYFHPSLARPFQYQFPGKKINSRAVIGQCAAILLRDKLPQGRESSLKDELIRQYAQTELFVLGDKGRIARQVFARYLAGGDGTMSREACMQVLEPLFDLSHLLDSLQSIRDIGEWVSRAEAALLRQADMGGGELYAILAIGLRNRLSAHPQERRLYESFIAYEIERSKKEQKS